ncbi:MAG: PQQ-binding-like beta-propeller repeat protein [Muribaculaceae bacterium]|nr:PQQ-binding-like beta-propeller repeat protein [Muribaculaceae bacterium]
MTLRHLFLSLSAAVVLSAPAQRIAVLSDIHVTPGNANEALLRQAVAEINSTPYDLVVVNGDLANEGSDAELTNVKSILDGITRPLCVLPGNHENNWSQSATKTFVDLWGNDRFVTTVDSLVVVGINCGPYMKMGDGHIKQEDLHWLRATLDSLVTPGCRVLSFNHYPLLDDLDNCAEYMEVLERYPVIAHVNGHYHRWRSYNAGGEASGSDLPCIMVRALDVDKTHGYSELEISPDWIHVYEKQLGRPRRAMYACPARTAHTKAVFAARPEVRAPEGFEVTEMWADSASVFTRLGFDKNNVYFGNSLGQARALAKDGSGLKWSTPTGASLFSRPVVLGNGRVAVPMYDGIMLLDPVTGRMKAKYKSAEGPYVADGTITPDRKGYIQGAYKRIERRRATDGKPVWSYDSIFNYCQAAPAIDGNDLVFGAWDTNLRCLDLRTGKLRWVWNNGKAANMLGPGNVVPVITTDKVFVVAPDRYMTALDRATGRQLWRDNSHRYRESLGHSEDGKRIYAKTMDGELVAVDALSPDFKELWTVDLGLGYEHAPCVIVEKDGIVYAGSRRGVVTMTRADGSGLAASLPLGVSEVNGIDVDPATGDVYVSLIEGKIYRIARK